MIAIRTAVPALVLLSVLLAGLAGAEEFSLTYGPAPAREGIDPSFRPGLGSTLNPWKKGGEILTDRARTLVVEERLASLDQSKEDLERFDVLHFDVNGNRALDEGETFAVERPHPDARETVPFFSTALMARKVPFNLPVVGREQRGYVNITIFRLDRHFYYSLAAWGCMAGEGELDGVPCRVILRDENANGVYGEVRRGPRSNPDSITVVRDGVEESQMLQSRMVIGSKVYAFDAINNGATLLLDPLETPFGRVTVPAEMTEVELVSREWGSFKVRHGHDELLPVGTYTVASFVRTRYRPFARCSYVGPTELEIAVTEEGAAAVSPETTLIASVKVCRKRGAISLGLSMVTSEGAIFDSHAAQSKENGIPFTITDGEGNVVVEDAFSFG